MSQVCDALEDQMCEGNNLVDYHGCDFFPERRATFRNASMNQTRLQINLYTCGLAPLELAMVCCVHHHYAEED